MLKYISLAASAVVIAGTVNAGSMDAPVIPPSPVVAAQAPDWGGFYAGAFASFDAGSTFDYYLNDVFDASHEMNSSDVYGGFAGYNIQRGNMVYGAEVAYSGGTTYLDGFPTYEFDSMLDVKARVGYAAGRALVFGAAGWSSAPWDNGFDSNFTMSGLNVGAGVDYLVTDRIFVGAEYLTRFLAGDAGNNLDSYEATVQTISVRAGVNF